MSRTFWNGETLIRSMIFLTSYSNFHTNIYWHFKTNQKTILFSQLSPICDAIPHLVPPPTLLWAGVGVDVVDQPQVHHQGYVGVGGVRIILKCRGNNCLAWIKSLPTAPSTATEVFPDLTAWKMSTHKNSKYLYRSNTSTVINNCPPGRVNHGEDEVHQVEDEAEHPVHHAVSAYSCMTWLQHIFWSTDWHHMGGCHWCLTSGCTFHFIGQSWSSTPIQSKITLDRREL